jgi:hypothetical protein
MGTIDQLTAETPGSKESRTIMRFSLRKNRMMVVASSAK